MPIKCVVHKEKIPKNYEGVLYVHGGKVICQDCYEGFNHKPAEAKKETVMPKPIKEKETVPKTVKRDLSENKVEAPVEKEEPTEDETEFL